MTDLHSRARELIIDVVSDVCATLSTPPADRILDLIKLGARCESRAHAALKATRFEALDEARAIVAAQSGDGFEAERALKELIEREHPT